MELDTLVINNLVSKPFERTRSEWEGGTILLAIC